MGFELHYSPIIDVAQHGEIAKVNSFSTSSENLKKWCKNLCRWLEFESLLCYPIFVRGKPAYAVVLASIWPHRFVDQIVEKVKIWTELLGAKLEANEAYGKLESIQGLALQGELTASLTHELRNRLDVLCTSLRSVNRCLPKIVHKMKLEKAEIPDDMEVVEKASSRAIAAADRIEEIVSSFSYTKEQKTLQTFDIHPIISSVLLRLTPVANRDHVTLNFTPGNLQPYMALLLGLDK